MCTYGNIWYVHILYMVRGTEIYGTSIYIFKNLNVDSFSWYNVESCYTNLNLSPRTNFQLSPPTPTPTLASLPRKLSAVAMALASGDNPIIDEEAGASSDALPALIRKPPKPFQNTEVGALITEEQFKWLMEARDTLIGAFQNQDHSNGLCNTAYMLYHLRLRRNGRKKRMTYINAGLFDHMFRVSREQNIHRGGRVNTTEELFHSLKIFNPEIRIDLLQAICTKDDVEDGAMEQFIESPPS